MIDPNYGIHIMLKIGAAVLVAALIGLYAIVFGPVFQGYINWYNLRNPDRKFFPTPNAPFELFCQKIEPDMDDKLKKELGTYKTVFGGFWLVVILVLVFCGLRELLHFF
jgi:hypothetical protein